MKFDYPLVECVWLDAETSFGWENVEDTDLSLAEAITVGFLLARNEHYLSIASTTSGGTCNSRIKIPIRMIQTLVELKATRQKKSLLLSPQSVEVPPLRAQEQPLALEKS